MNKEVDFENSFNSSSPFKPIVVQGTRISPEDFGGSPNPSEQKTCSVVSTSDSQPNSPPPHSQSPGSENSPKKAKSSTKKELSEEEKEKRRVQRLMRNRASAAQSRQRKKEYVEGLEQKLSDLEQQNSFLKTENELLKEEIVRLRAELEKSSQPGLMKHRNEGVPIQHQQQLPPEMAELSSSHLQSFPRKRKHIETENGETFLPSLPSFDFPADDGAPLFFTQEQAVLSTEPTQLSFVAGAGNNYLGGFNFHPSFSYKAGGVALMACLLCFGLFFNPYTNLGSLSSLGGSSFAPDSGAMTGRVLMTMSHSTDGDSCLCPCPCSDTLTGKKTDDTIINPSLPPSTSLLQRLILQVDGVLLDLEIPKEVLHGVDLNSTSAEPPVLQCSI
eukprot:GCRY01000944.1.p1 GENE.GCRY01000944.1~~GCRY01000944.1.p1  ORF type:complete len:403 (-),score=53.33 GCRY01000944.1:13-1173(-)